MDTEEVKAIKKEFLDSIPAMQNNTLSDAFRQMADAAFDKGYITCAKRVVNATL